VTVLELFRDTLRHPAIKVQLDPCIVARFKEDTKEQRRAAAALERANRRALKAWKASGRPL
jgi:hypothetical protein